MGQLRRTGKPLLRQVNHKPTSAAFQESAKGRANNLEIDPDADPISSPDPESDGAESLPDDRSEPHLRNAPQKGRRKSPAETKDQEASSESTAEPRKQSKNSPHSTRAALVDNNFNSQRGEQRRGQKRDRGITSSDASALTVPEDHEQVFAGVYGSQSSKRAKKQYSNRSTASKTSNMHASPEKKCGASKSKRIQGFRNPSRTESSPPHANKTAFHVPDRFHENSDTVKKKASFEVPPRSSPSAKSSISARFKPVGSGSDPSTPSTPGELGDARERHDHQTMLQDSLNSPPGSPDLSPFDANMAFCPMCKAEVDREFLDLFSHGKKLRLKAAMDFCVAHKQRSAQSHWDVAEYPSIDWSNLDKRLRNFDRQLKAILEQRAPSTFRQELEEKVASGRSRNALRNPEGDGTRTLKGITGYYGTKGGRKMMEHITTKFASKIRTLAAKDKLFTEVGVSGFVQAVLLPELVLLLVMEDFEGCDKERAQGIVNESAEMGDLLNEEEEERVDEETQVDADLVRDSKPARNTRSASRSFIVIE